MTQVPNRSGDFLDGHPVRIRAPFPASKLYCGCKHWDGPMLCVVSVLHSSKHSHPAEQRAPSKDYFLDNNKKSLTFIKVNDMKTECFYVSGDLPFPRAAHHLSDLLRYPALARLVNLSGFMSQVTGGLPGKGSVFPGTSPARKHHATFHAFVFLFCGGFLSKGRHQ